jgi:hypothetical protein
MLARVCVERQGAATGDDVVFAFERFGHNAPSALAEPLLPIDVAHESCGMPSAVLPRHSTCAAVTRNLKPRRSAQTIGAQRLRCASPAVTIRQDRNIYDWSRTSASSCTSPALTMQEQAAPPDRQPMHTASLVFIRHANRISPAGHHGLCACWASNH